MTDTLLAILLAFLLDFKFSEPKIFHPLVGFGHWANVIEARLRSTKTPVLWAGRIAWSAAVLPWVLITLLGDNLLSSHHVMHTLFMAFMLYLSIGWQSLIQHAKAIQKPLTEQDLSGARLAVSMIVSRKTDAMSENDVAIAATESVLENGADAIFSAVFWFLVLGVPGLVLYRLSNTLDAMWGYKNDRYLAFGQCAARIDDALNFIPARITALLYACARFDTQSFKQAIHCWRTQAAACSSPNGGPVMCAGAGAIQATLGGVVDYHGKRVEKPPMGVKASTLKPAEMISRACQLLNASVGLLVLLLLFSLLLVQMS